MSGRALLIAAVVLLAGCAGPTMTQRDGPPASAPDPGSLPEIVPRNEPLSDSGNPESYTVMGQTFAVLDSAQGYAAEGIASWYGTKFHGRRTSSGEPYNMFAMTAAHTTLPLPTYVRVHNLENGRSTVVKVNDRGPFIDDRLIDLSYAAASRLGMQDQGTARVRVEALAEGTPIMAGSDGGGEGSADDTTASASADEPAGPAAASSEAERAAAFLEEDATGADGFQGEAYIQLGAFEEFVNAQQVRAKATGADVRDVIVSRVRGSDGRRIYRVRVGPLADPAERDEVRERLRSVGLEGGRVVVD